MSEQKIPIPSRLYNAAVDGHVAGTEDIIDDVKGKTQNVINQETDNALDNRYTKDQTYNKSELNNMITTPDQQYVTLIAQSGDTLEDIFDGITGEADTTYRVGNWDGTANSGAGGYDITLYSEYAYDGTNFVHLSNKTQIGEVFDISAYKATGGTLATFDDLEDALDSGNNVPVGIRKGGMSVKFVQNTDNKYVQYRLTSQSFNTQNVNWQKFEATNQMFDNTIMFGKLYAKVDKSDFIYGINYNSNGDVSDSDNRLTTPFYHIKSGSIITCTIPCPSSSLNIICFDYNRNILVSKSHVGTYGEFSFTIPSDVVFVRFCCQSSLVENVVINISPYGLVADINGLQEEIDDLKNAQENFNKIFPNLSTKNGILLSNVTFIDGVSVSVDTGAETSNENYASTDYIDVTDYIILCFSPLPYSASRGVAFFDENKNIMPQYRIGSSNGGIVQTFIPKDVKYIRLTKNVASVPSVILYGGKQVDTRFCIDSLINGNTNDGYSRIFQEKYYPLTNMSLSYQYNDETYYYLCSMPNHQMLNDGTIVLVSELFYQDTRTSRAGLVIRRSTDGGKTWSSNISFENVQLTNGIITDNDGGGNPVLLYDRINDVLYLFYQTKGYRKSTDGGINWSEKYSVSSLFSSYEGEGYQCYASPCNGIQLTNGVLALCYRLVKPSQGISRILVLYSNDYGITWNITPATDVSVYIDETALVEYRENTIMLNARGGAEIDYGNAQVNRRVLVQTNQGASQISDWSVSGWEIDTVSDMQIIDGNCQGSFIKATVNNNIFGLFINLYNISAKRQNLLLRVSSDFKHWTPCFYLSAPAEIIHGYSSMCSINNVISICSEDANGIYYLSLNYELMDKVLRLFKQNQLVYAI